jgi:hypothetical protein
MRLNKQVFLAHHQGRRIQRSKLKSMSMRNRICGASLNTIPAKDAAVVVDVVDLRVSFSARDPLLCGILSSLDINAVRRTCRRAQEARYALFQAILVALQLVLATKTLLKLRTAHRPFAVRIVFDLSRLKHFLERDAHSLSDGGRVADDGHNPSISCSGHPRYDNPMPTSHGTLRVALSLALLAATPLYSNAQAMPEHEHPKAAPSTNLVLTIDGTATTLTVADLEALPQKTITVHNEHTKTDETYTGVYLSDLLTKYGVPFDRPGEKKIFHSYLRVEGTDHYYVLYSGSEVESAIHNADVIVATKLNGKPLADDGQIKLVASDDKRPARWVRNLSAITLVTVP